MLSGVLHRFEDEAIDILDTLDAKLHPRQRKGLRFVLWSLVNAAQSFFSFWRYCYGCGKKDACTCAPDDPYAFVIGARTAWSVAWGIWKPKWDDRRRVMKPIPVTIVPQSTLCELAQHLHYLDQRVTTRPWTVESSEQFSGNNWLIASFGNDSETNLNAFLTTDHVHASECGGEGARADAEFCAEVRNLLPQIVAALRSRAAFEAGANERPEVSA